MCLLSEKFTDLLKDSGYRRSYSNLMKASSVLERSKACCEFLKDCHENDVLPNSCKVKISAKPSYVFLGKRVFVNTITDYSNQFCFNHKVNITSMHKCRDIGSIFFILETLSPSP